MKRSFRPGRAARLGRATGIALGAALLALTAACGGSSASSTVSSGASPSAAASASSAGEADFLTAAKAAVATNYLGTDRTLPSSAPKPKAGKNVWVISCLQAAEGCAVPAAGAKAAGELLGWKMTVFDGKGSPDVYAKGIRSAAANKADGIILDVIDCVAAKQALVDAKAAGVKIFAFYSLDCDDPFVKGQPVFDASLQYINGRTYADQTENAYSKSVADYVIAKTEGKAKVIEFTEDDILVGKHLYAGFETNLKPCSTCTIVKKVPFTLADLVGGKLQAKAAAALTQHPEATVLYVPYDSALTLGIAQAVLSSGRNDSLLVTGGEGLTPNIGFLRTNAGQDFAAGSPSQWVGWAAIDGMNRLLQGQPQVDEGIGSQSMDREHNLPTGTPYYDGNVNPDGTAKADYKANFKKIWGIG